MITYPVSVHINGKVQCIEHIETDELMRPGACYLYMEHDLYSDFDIYLDFNTRKYVAADVF